LQMPTIIGCSLAYNQKLINLKSRGTLSIILALTVMLNIILGVLIKIYFIKRSEPEGSDYEYKKHRVCFLSKDLPEIYQFGKKFAAVVDAYDAKDFFHVVFYGIFTDEKTFGNIPV